MITISCSHIGLPNLPACECQKIENFLCKGAVAKVSYPTPTSSIQKTSFNIRIPDISSASTWFVTAYLSFSDLNMSFFNIEASSEWKLNGKGKIIK